MLYILYLQFCRNSKPVEEALACVSVVALFYFESGFYEEEDKWCSVSTPRSF